MTERNLSGFYVFRSPSPQSSATQGEEGIVAVFSKLLPLPLWVRAGVRGQLDGYPDQVRV